MEQTDENGWTGFIYACNYNKIYIVKLLTKKNSKIIDQRDVHGNTGFIHACYNRLYDVLKFLLNEFPQLIN